MTEKEILLRKSLLHAQAASLFRQDAARHEAEAHSLQEKAALLEDQDNEKT